MAYVADAKQLDPGSIVKIERPLNSSGKPTYPHYFVLMNVPDPIELDAIIPLVGISSRINPQSADPARHVAMKWLDRQGGDPETGFNKRCFACMDFTETLTIYRGRTFQFEVAAEYRGKFIRADKLHTVVAAMNAWARLQDGRSY